ncbi:uncharacterized protein LOC143202526 [Rhynchophorus ferrugineus]|uniref:uncharacterized protein LOC143202526 n=1 Tax=Rhynchophorus ferrugineus TaxID=354439 RepID=UPI003FCEA3FF
MAFLLIVTIGLLGTASCHQSLLIDKLRMDFLQVEEAMWKYVLWESPHIRYSESINYLVDTFSEFDQSLKQMPDDIVYGLEPIRHIHTFLFLYPEFKQMERLYEKFRQYLEDQKLKRIRQSGPFQVRVDSDEMVRDIFNNKNGANVTVNAVYNMTFGAENMLMKVLTLIDNNYYCQNYSQSPQQVFYNLYNAVALNGLKSFIMTQFVYLMKCVEEGRGNNNDLALINKYQFKKRVNETMTVIRGAMELVSVDLWKCDPKHHVKGKTYDEFTRLIQGHVQNEADMNSDRTCTKNCQAYSLTKNYGCYDGDSQYCKEIERCNGKIIGCRYIESSMEICTAKEVGNRRYEYVKFDNDLYYGKKNTCWKKPVQSWYRWFVHCSYCMCLCDDPNILSDRFINLKPVYSDIRNNRVVTGIKFVKVNRILHLQIQEGQLLPYGNIKQSTVQWVPVDNYTITDPYMYNYGNYYRMSYENRTMALDQISTKAPKQVVTGVQFKVIQNMVRLEVIFNEIDWESGIIITNSQVTMNGPSRGLQKVSIDSNADVPTLASMSMLVNAQNKFVEFTHTGFEVDAAQTTIPFIDTQPVYNNPAVPLKGIGIGYKTFQHYGGFITPISSSYDYSKLLLSPTFKNKNN